MVDLRAQYEKIGLEIDNAIKSVILSTAFIKGPDVKLFEEELQEYMGVKHVVSCANGTDALHLAIRVLGLEPGDEVITTNFTFIATVEVVALLGLKLVLVDPEPGYEAGTARTDRSERYISRMGACAPDSDGL